MAAILRRPAPAVNGHGPEHGVTGRAGWPSGRRMRIIRRMRTSLELPGTAVIPAIGTI